MINTLSHVSGTVPPSKQQHISDALSLHLSDTYDVYFKGELPWLMQPLKLSLLWHSLCTEQALDHNCRTIQFRFTNKK